MPLDNDLAGIRKDYRLQSLLEKDVDADAMKQFEIWWRQAIESEIDEPNAMTLATCTVSGKPSARIVLLKAIRNNGFVFFSNYDSRKGKQINDNPFVSLVFFWKELERQVRIAQRLSSLEGKKKKISPFLLPSEAKRHFLNLDPYFNVMVYLCSVVQYLQR